MAEFHVIIEKDEDGWYVASIPEVQGCYTQGKTLNQALERVKEALEVCLKADGGNIRPMKFVGIQKIE